MKTHAAIKGPLFHVTLLRHGESTGNAQGLLQGQKDYELSPLGRHQSQCLAARWVAEAQQFDKIITSPLTRALQTAEIISVAINVPFKTDHNWMERDFGILSGRALSEEDLNILRRNFKNPFEPLGDTGESQWDAYHRATRAINDLLQRPPGRYLIVAHGGIINQALHVILGLTPQSGSDGPRFILSNAGFASLSYAPDERVWRLFKLNDNQHLKDLSSDMTAVLEAEDSGQVKETRGNPPSQTTSSLSVQIRPAQSKDLDGIIRIFAETDHPGLPDRPDAFRQLQESYSTRSYYESQLMLPDVHLLVADVNGEIAGCLHAMVNNSHLDSINMPQRWLSIAMISVAQTYQDKAVMQSLLLYTQELALKLGLHAIELITHEFSGSSHQIYKRLGYQNVKQVMWLELR
jgi:2,3-bisphosphoglycerate-dependent phosphoglycerate mutase